MTEMIEGVLYRDPQSVAPACCCRRCGGERYAPGRRCLRCERRGRP